MTITESLARFFGHTALADEFGYSSLQLTPPSFQNGEDNWRKPTRADDLQCLDDIISVTATSPRASVAEEDVETKTAPSPPGTDLRMD